MFKRLLLVYKYALRMDYTLIESNTKCSKQFITVNSSVNVQN